MREMVSVRDFFDSMGYIPNMLIKYSVFWSIYSIVGMNDDFKNDKYKNIYDLLFMSYETIDPLNPTLTANATNWVEFGKDYIARSGDKNISKFLYELEQQAKSYVYGDYTIRLSNAIGSSLLFRFGQKWEKLIETFNKEYNPIHNYDMNEDENFNTNLTTTNNTDEFVSGFNSSSQAPNGSNENTVNTTGSATDNNRHLERSGNIGVTTTQQMIQQEIELRRFIILEEMFKDIDSLLTLSIY